MQSEKKAEALDPRQQEQIRRAIFDERLAKMPRFRTAVLADLRIMANERGVSVNTERYTWHTIWKLIALCWETHAFFALVLYRLRTSLRRRRIPFLPRLLEKFSMILAQVCIGDPVIIQPGLRLPHGQVVIDGATLIESNVRIRPFVTIGLMEGNYQGPTIKRGASIGTGAKILGPVTLGRGCVVGANAVVIKSVAANTTVVGVPARPVKKENGPA